MKTQKVNLEFGDLVDIINALNEFSETFNSTKQRYVKTRLKNLSKKITKASKMKGLDFILTPQQ